MRDLSTGFGKYRFYDCGAYGLFTLSSERFQPTNSGKMSSQYDQFFRRERAPIDPLKILVWQELGHILKAFGSSVTVLDVGAYIGTFCIPLALSAKVEGVELRIHSFEPGPTQDIVEINVDANGLSDIVTVHRYAVSNFDGYRVYTFEEGGSVGGNVYASATEKSVERIAPVRTIDTFCANVDGPLLIKLDTQGHEPRIMDRARKVISEKRAVWFIEFLKWSGSAIVDGEPFHAILNREFYVFEGTREITAADMPRFLDEVDARTHRMADLLLIPKGAEFTDRVLAAARSAISV